MSVSNSIARHRLSVPPGPRGGHGALIALTAVLVAAAVWLGIGALDASRSAGALSRIEDMVVLLAIGLAGWWRHRVVAARNEARRDARLERALSRVAGASARADLDELAFAGLVSEVLAELLGGSSAGVVRFDEGRLTILATGGDAPISPDVTLDERSASGQVAQTGRSAVVDDYRLFAGQADERAPSGRSAVAVPVHVAGVLWGSLSAVLPRPAVPAETVELLERFATLVSAALANAAAQTQLREEARLERALAEVARATGSRENSEKELAKLVAGVVAELLDSPSTGVVRFDDGRLTALALGGEAAVSAGDQVDAASTSGEVARTAEVVVVDHYGQTPGPYADYADSVGGHSVVSVPIRVEGRLWGCLGAMLRVPVAPASSVALLERFAILVAAALANAEAHRELSEEARMERALREVATAAAGVGAHAEALFDLVAARVADLLDAPAAGVIRFDQQWLTVVGWAGTAARPGRISRDEHTASAEVAQTGRPARIVGYDATAGETSAIVADAGMGCGIGAPIFIEGALWGCISAARASADVFRQEHEEWLERFAALVSVALARADTLAALERQARSDGLTGLVNHRCFQQQLEREFTRAKRHGRPMSLIMFDLDGFKLVNDIHGHDAGDRVLRVVGRALQRGRRSSDIPARIGGDEFALVAPETSADEALLLAERIRAAAAAAIQAAGMSVTVSAGVADAAIAATKHDLCHLADSALYHAKHSGRDHAVRYAAGVERIGEARPDEETQRTPAAGLASLVRALGANDAPTRLHSERVARIAGALAARRGWSAQRCARLREAALLHDVGKLAVPEGILNKAGALTAEEYQAVKAHAALGAHIAASTLDAEQVRWVRAHHERPDGKGYPDGRKFAQIPDGALLLGIADAYDSMTSDRPYRRAMSSSAALAELRRHAGTQFDRDLVDLLERWVAEGGAVEAGGGRRHTAGIRARRPGPRE